MAACCAENKLWEEGHVEIGRPIRRPWQQPGERWWRPETRKDRLGRFGRQNYSHLLKDEREVPRERGTEKSL